MLLVIILFAVPRYIGDPNSAEPFRYVDRTCCFSQASHFLDDPTCGLVCPDRSTIYFAWDKRRRDQILSCRVGSRPGDSNTVVSLVPRRRIERLVSNVYACAEFFLTFQEYRIFPITFVAHLRHFQQLWLCSMMHYATRFKYWRRATSVLKMSKDSQSGTHFMAETYFRGSAPLSPPLFRTQFRACVYICIKAKVLRLASWSLFLLQEDTWTNIVLFVHQIVYFVHAWLYPLGLCLIWTFEPLILGATLVRLGTRLHGC